MSSSISGIFLHVFSSWDDKKVDEISKQRAQLREMLEVATNHLRDCHYNQAKINFVEARTYLKSCKKRTDMNLPDELDFYINVVICYSFTMELDSIKDVNTEDFKKEDQSMKNEIDGLVKKYPKRHFPLFLRLLYSFKKECWREAIYYCELVQNFKIHPDEEGKYKSTPIFSKHLIPELDIDYCNDVVHNIEEAAIYGLVENVAKLDDLKNSKSTLAGFNWVNLWSKDCNEKIIKRLRSYKKPMNSFQLHKLFHTEILPKFYTLNKSVGKSLFCYYKKEFMYQCEECLRAKLQQESRNELFGRLCDHSSDENMSDDDSDLFDTETDDNEDELGSNNEDVLILPPDPKKEKVDKGTNVDKSDNTVAQKAKVEKSNEKKATKCQQVQTEKIKIGHRYVQTECTIKKKSIATQTDGGTKAKRQEKAEKQGKEKQDELKCSKCKDNTKLFSFFEEIKNQVLMSKAEMRESLQDQLNDLLKQMKQIREEKYTLKDQNERNIDKSIEIMHSKEIIAKLEKQLLIMHDMIDKERTDLTGKNVLLQKILVDQINDKYLLYKSIYSGLENNCRVIIANVTELQNFLTSNSFPNAKDNQAYLGRWEKTLLDLQRKNGQLKSFYKKTKAQMLHLSEYEFCDWPEIAEIPIEAFSFLFDSLKQNVKNANRGQQKPLDRKIINNQPNTPPPPPPIQPNQMPVGQMYPVPPPTMRHLMERGLVYNTYQQPPPPSGRMYIVPVVPYVRARFRYGTYQPPTYPNPIPMPPTKNPNAQFSTWSQNSNPNAQMYQPGNNHMPNNPNMLDFFKNFHSAVDNDVSSQKDSGGLISPSFKQTCKSPSLSVNQERKNKAVEKVDPSSFWDDDNINSSLSKSPNETNRSQNQCTAATSAPINHKEKDMDMNDYFSAYSTYKTTNTSGSLNRFLSDSKLPNFSDNQPALKREDQQREHLIQNGFWALDNQSEDWGNGSNQVKDLGKDGGAHGSIDKLQVKTQETENACKSAASSLSSVDNLSGKIIHRPVRPIPKLINVCKEEDRQQYDAEKELFQYLRINCTDVDNNELIATILKVLKKFNGSFNNVPKTDILKEVRSTILSNKHGVWISPKSPLVDWDTDIADSHCSICFDDLNQRAKSVLPCKHQYHKDCISQWLRTNSVCPICRVHSVIDEDYPPLS